jgi:drug/metabolite transporter (DMT)-like permease
MAAVILVIIVLISGNSLIGYPREAYLWFLLLAIIPQLMGHSTFNWALGYLSAAYVSISMLGEPIGSTILAYIVLDETPTLFMIFGAILIMAGIYLASLGEQKIQNL